MTTTTTTTRTFTPSELTSATPVEIDTVLADLYGQESRLRSERMDLVGRIMSAAGLRLASDRRSWSNLPVGTLEEALEALQFKAAAAAEAPRWVSGEPARLLKAYQDNQFALVANEALQEPLQAEYRRRGTWSRAFLVFASNGHVHRSMHCGTCFPTTRYGWLVELSGSSEADIVAAIGADACTMCYPSAPVEKGLPRTVLHPTEKAAAAERAERDAAKAARAAAKAAKAIANPDGSPLEVFDWRVPERQHQNRDGSVRIVAAHDRFTTIETLHAAKGWLTDSRETGYRSEKRPADVQRVAEAIAFKLGTTPEVELAAAVKRAAKRNS